MKTNFLITAILLLTANVLTTRAEQRKNCIDVAVFSINDFHAAFVSNPDKGIAGAANLVHTLDSLKQLYPYHVTVSAGDNFGGSYFYNATRSRSLLPQLLTDLDIRISAIGNHDEKTAFPVNPVAAALILADKMDVRANRVREKARAAFDIHDRVNYSVKKHEVTLTEKEICLTLAIDTEVCAVIEYFEIFMDRMLLCRRAAEKLGLHFALVINGQRMA
mgnify:CR=1 FL=1